MLLLGMRTYVVLLWGVSVLFSEVSVSDLVTVDGSDAATADPLGTKQLISTRQAHNVSAAAAAATAATATAAAATDTTVPTTVETQRPIGDNRSGDSTAGLFATGTAATAAATAAAAAAAAATANSSSPGALQTVSTAGAAAPPSTNMMITETGKPTEHHLRRLSPTASADKMSSSPVTSAAPPAEATTVSLLQPSSTAEPEVPSNFSSSTSSAHSIQSTDFTQNGSSPSASYSASTIGGRTTSVAATMSTTSLASMRETNGTEPSASSEALFETTASSSASNFTPTAERNSSTETVLSSTPPADTNVSSTPVGVIPHRVTKAIPNPTTKPTPDTTKSAKSSTTTEIQACSTRAVAVNCLIAIATLAALATIFMVTTIVLCTMLSARKYKVKKPSQDTEMMCISSLLPEMNYSYTRQRNPVPNGVLVIHNGRDSDEDMGDNLTLSSFLPENDRFI